MVATVSILAIGILSGCSVKKTPGPPKSDESVVDVKLVTEKGDEKFKKALLESVRNVEKQYVSYMMLLEKLKRKRSLPRDKIPLGMGKRVSLSFDGYLLDLISKVVAEAGYDVKLINLTVTDSPVVSRNYIDTRIIDVLDDAVSYGGYDVEIDEKNKVVTISKE